MDWIKNTYELQLVTIFYGSEVRPSREYTIKNFDRFGKELGDVFGVGSRTETVSHMKELADRINQNNNHVCTLNLKGIVLKKDPKLYDLKVMKQNQNRISMKNRIFLKGNK